MPRTLSHASLTGLALLLGGASCGPAPAPSPKTATPPPVAYVSEPRGPEIRFLSRPRAAEPVPLTPFGEAGEVASPGQTLADWTSPVGEHEAWGFTGRVLAAGRRAAVVRRGAWLFATHRDRGAIGPLAIPQGVFWIGLDGADALFAASADGTLFRLRDLARGRDPAAFEPLVQIPSAVAWDVTDGLLVALGEQHVMSSGDGGQSFRWAELHTGMIGAQIAARTDGVVVALAHERGDARSPGTWVSRDRGATFEHSTFPARSIRREGAQIHASNGGCEATLSVDGVTWSTAQSGSTWSLRSAWEKSLSAHENAAAAAPEDALTLFAPPAPPAPAGGQRAIAGSCPAAVSRRGGDVGGGLFGALGQGFLGSASATGILGIARSHPPYPKPSAIRWSFLRDVTCTEADVDTTSRFARTCRTDRPLSRPPRVRRTDEQDLSFRLLDVPAGCAPAHLQSVRGTAILSCAAGPGAYNLYTAGRDDRWYPEGALTCASPARLFDAREDGSFALACGAQGDPTFALWVRRPAPLGTPGAFRKVHVEEAIAHRLLDGGRVVAITTKGKPAPGIGLGSVTGSGHLAGHHAPRDSKGKTTTINLADLPAATPAPGAGTAKPASPKTNSAPPKSPPSPATAAEERARHTFSVVLDAPAGAATTLARDLVVKGDVVALATVGDDVFFRASTGPKKTAHLKLERGKLREIPLSQAPPEVRAPLALLGVSGALGGGERLSLAPPAPGSLAADATHLYFTDSAAGTVLRVPRAGGASEVVAKGLVRPHALTVEGGQVFVTALGNVERSSGDAGVVAFVPTTPQGYTLGAQQDHPIGPLDTFGLIAVGQHRPLAIAADREAVYWITQGLEGSATGALYKYSRTTRRSELLLGKLASPRSLALDATRVFVAHGFGQISAIPKAGGPPLFLGARGDLPHALLLLGERVVWTVGNEPTLAAAPIAGGKDLAAIFAHLPRSGSADSLFTTGEDLWMTQIAAGRVLHAKPGTGRAEQTLSDLDAPSAVFVDDTSVFIRESDGARLRRFPRNGGPPVVLHGK